MTALNSFLGVPGFDYKGVPNSQLPLPNQLVGVELEVDMDSQCAANTVMPTAFRPEWQKKHDGSLSNGYEFVLTGPLAGQDLTNAIYKLFSGDTKVHRTYTGSTHIHLNMLDGTTLQQLQALALLTYAMEGLLYYIGDNSRQWCGYANRITGAPHAVLENLLGASVDRRGLHGALNSAGRYYGLNLAALEKYGTVEFRYFPTATSPEELVSWVGLVQQLKKAACELGTVTEVLATLSDKSKYAEFVSNYLPEYANPIAESCPYNKVKVLANKALVIANAKRSGTQVWNKELLSSFFKKPTPVSGSPVVINLKWLRSSGVPDASAARAAAREEGFDDVVLSYGSHCYLAVDRTWGGIVWEGADHWLITKNTEFASAVIDWMQSNGVTQSRADYYRRCIGNGSTTKYNRHARFVRFNEQNVAEDYDDYEEPEPYHDDDEEEF